MRKMFLAVLLAGCVDEGQRTVTLEDGTFCICEAPPPPEDPTPEPPPTE